MSQNAVSQLTSKLLLKCMIALVFRYDLLMVQCWSVLPEERPPFSQLVKQLQEYWEENQAYIIENTDTPSNN